MKFDLFIGSRKGLFISVFLPVLVCFLFPTANSTQDGWGYAADAVWKTDLFQPHHLFYTFQLFLFSRIVTFYDVLLLGKHLNSIYLGASLFVFSKLLSKYNSTTIKVNTITFFVGTSFAVLRFATENETYIVPVFYSLVGSLFFVKYEIKREIKYLIFSGFFLAFACLMHQIHFFWWLCILGYLVINSKSNFVRPIMLFSAPAIIVPLSYILVLILYKHQSLSITNLTHFIFESFYSGSSTLLFDLNGVLRFFVAILRSFIQIHGNVFIALQKFSFLCVPAFLLIFILVISLIKLCKTFKWRRVTESKSIYLYGAIFCAHLAFALFSYGNSEMLVMIPFVFGILIFLTIDFSNFYLFILSISIFAWNLVFGLILNNQIVFNSNNYWLQKVEEQKKNVFYLRYSTEINNIVYYSTGKTSSNCFYPKCKDEVFLEKRIDSLLSEKVNVYTDCIESGAIKNTVSLVFDQQCISFFEKYKVIKVDSAPILGQFEYLYKLELR